MSKQMKVTLLILATPVALFALAAIVGGIFFSAPEVPTTPAAAPAVVEAPPGSPAVYERISAMTDCQSLQAEFDTADRNHGYQQARQNLKLMQVSSGYMNAADTRMNEIGCYG